MFPGAEVHVSYQSFSVCVSNLRVEARVTFWADPWGIKSLDLRSRQDGNAEWSWCKRSSFSCPKIRRSLSLYGTESSVKLPLQRVRRSRQKKSQSCIIVLSEVFVPFRSEWSYCVRLSYDSSAPFFVGFSQISSAPQSYRDEHHAANLHFQRTFLAPGARVAQRETSVEDEMSMFWSCNVYL